MRNMAVSHTREREVFKFVQNKMQGTGVKSHKVQPVVLRLFSPVTASDRTISFNLSAGDGKSIVPELEYMVLSGRVAIVFAGGFGFCRVPLEGGKEQWAFAEYTSNPYNTDIVPAANRKAILAAYNGFTLFKTNDVDRLAKLATSVFLGESPDEVKNSIKHVMFPAAYTLIGGEENVWRVSIPTVGDLTTIIGDTQETPTFKYYAVAELRGFEIVESGGNQAKIARALNS